MKYLKGERVTHPTKSDWGMGQVLEDSNANNVKIFFVGVGEKTIALDYIKPIKVEAASGAYPVLDNLTSVSSKAGIKYQSLPHSINFFLEQFSEGFYGARFMDEERVYKDKAHHLAISLLGKEQFEALLGERDFPEICKRALKIMNATNLVFPNEKMALKDGLDSSESQERFAVSLFEILFGLIPLEKRFTSFAKVLEDIGAGKWTIATYFLFIIQPEKYMFVKPTITQHAADLCGISINYQPQLNWLTYRLVLDFSEYLKKELTVASLKPRDMIDVQSFMWCIAPRD
jgi:hypothetical protein